MSSILTAKNTDAAAIDAAWFQSCSVTAVEHSPPRIWSFSFSSGVYLSVECLWRLVSPDHIAVTSEDHGHKFGFPSAVNAAKGVSRLLHTATVTTYILREPTLDLMFAFSNGYVLDVLPSSSGYEAWHIVSPEKRHFVAQGDGELSTYSVGV